MRNFYDFWEINTISAKMTVLTTIYGMVKKKPNGHTISTDILYRSMILSSQPAAEYGTVVQIRRIGIGIRIGGIFKLLNGKLEPQ